MKTIKDIRIYALVSVELHDIEVFDEKARQLEEISEQGLTVDNKLEVYDSATHFVLSNLQDASIKYSISDLKIR